MTINLWSSWWLTWLNLWFVIVINDGTKPWFNHHRPSFFMLQKTPIVDSPSLLDLVNHQQSIGKHRYRYSTLHNISHLVTNDLTCYKSYMCQGQSVADGGPCNHQEVHFMGVSESYKAIPLSRSVPLHTPESIAWIAHPHRHLAKSLVFWLVVSNRFDFQLYNWGWLASWLAHVLGMG